MTISAVQTEEVQVPRVGPPRIDSACLLNSNIDFLERNISQLAIEKDLLQKNAESCISILELHIRKLLLERELLVRERLNIARRLTVPVSSDINVSCVPIATLCQFLDAADIYSYRATSKQVYEQCHPAESRLVVPHLTPPVVYLSIEEAEALVDSLCLGMVETLFIDAKKPSGKSLMHALSSRGSELKALRSLRVSAAAETGDFLTNLSALMAGLRDHQIESIHFSGLRSLSLVTRLIAKQCFAIKHFKVDYFVNGHESDVSEIPHMPSLRSFVFDVADVVHLPVSVISALLEAVEDRKAVEMIYLPHMQIAGQSHEIVDFIELLKSFNSVRQLVVRFRRLPLSVKEIVSLREAFESLPAVCISDHFIVMLYSWASWWPKQSSIWPSADRITGLSVFREQIDFESLGTTANREWLRLTRKQKNLWSGKIAANVAKLYLRTM
jgi:hypothetical protein